MNSTVTERRQFFKIKLKSNITTQGHINDQHLLTVDGAKLVLLGLNHPPLFKVKNELPQQTHHKIHSMIHVHQIFSTESYIDKLDPNFARSYLKLAQNILKIENTTKTSSVRNNQWVGFGLVTSSTK